MERNGTAATKAKNRWNRDNYDQFLLTLPKGDKERYRAYADAEDMSLNKFFIQAIEEKISNSKGQ